MLQPIRVFPDIQQMDTLREMVSLSPESQAVRTIEAWSHWWPSCPQRGESQPEKGIDMEGRKAKGRERGNRAPGEMV